MAQRQRKQGSEADVDNLTSVMRKCTCVHRSWNKPDFALGDHVRQRHVVVLSPPGNASAVAVYVNEYDENERDDDYNEGKKSEDPPAMDLPEDLNLEQDGKEEDGEADKDTDAAEDNPLDIDNMIEEGETKEDEKEGGEEESGVDAEGKEMDTEDGKGEEEKKPETGEGEEMEVDTEEGEDEVQKEEDESSKDQPGMEPKEVDMEDDENDGREGDKKSEDVAQAAEHAGKTKHDSENVQESEHARDATANNEEQEREGGGRAETEKEEGHEGDNSTSVTTSRSQRHQQTAQRQRQRPGQSLEDRSLGSVDEKVERHLKTLDSKNSENHEEREGESDTRSELYEHVKDSQSQHDTQTMDAATANQEQTQPVPMMQEDEDHDDVIDDDTEMKPDDSDQVDDQNKIDKLQAAKLKPKTQKERQDGETGADGDGTNEDETMEISGEKVETSTVGRGLESSFHTAMDRYNHYDRQPGGLNVEKLRAELEQQLQIWSHPAANTDASWEEERKAMSAWLDYEALTQGLAQELCEQLRLVLEPSQATKLKGDYRTGKRLNMRKVIPYIASQFRKDKIWLRRTKPSKRQYQVMIAVDDSSSMADNHSRQLAFESLAVIANALSLLEVGEVGICSFGESTGLLHPFQEQFSSQSGAKILQQFSFEQKKTKIAQLLKHITGIMLQARGQQRGGGSTSGEISQLLLIVSDGRGLFLEGMEAVKSSIRQAMEANVFVVFVVIDNPNNKDSILDIRVPIFKGPGELPEIKSYMDIFPFPFYVILRDTGSLPHTLSDALRQWFELVTASDK